MGSLLRAPHRGGQAGGLGRYGLVLLAVLAIGAAAMAQGAPPAGLGPDTVIVPGRSIGPWSLDTSFANLLWSLGVRDIRLTSIPGSQFRNDLEQSSWPDPPVVAIHGPMDDMVYALGIAASRYMTREGVGVGASEEKVVAAYGPASSVVQAPARPKYLIYNNRGLAFQVAVDPVSGKYSTVDRVFVFRPGRAGAIWRL